MQAICILLGVPEARPAPAVRVRSSTSFDFKGGRERSRHDDRRPAGHGAVDVRVRHGHSSPTSARTRPTTCSRWSATPPCPTQDPEHLLDDELQFFFSLLWAAGADTTRNAWWAADCLRLPSLRNSSTRSRADRTILPSAVEEIVRWTHPASYNRRTATLDTQLGGHTVAAGAKVVFWEASANRERTRRVRRSVPLRCAA